MRVLVDGWCWWSVVGRGGLGRAGSTREARRDGNRRLGAGDGGGRRGGGNGFRTLRPAPEARPSPRGALTDGPSCRSSGGDAGDQDDRRWRPGGLAQDAALPASVSGRRRGGPDSSSLRKRVLSTGGSTTRTEE